MTRSRTDKLFVNCNIIIIDRSRDIRIVDKGILSLVTGRLYNLEWSNPGNYIAYYDGDIVLRLRDHLDAGLLGENPVLEIPVSIFGAAGALNLFGYPRESQGL